MTLHERVNAGRPVTPAITRAEVHGVGLRLAVWAARI
jgi:hypothetical protein